MYNVTVGICFSCRYRSGKVTCAGRFDSYDTLLYLPLNGRQVDQWRALIGRCKMGGVKGRAHGGFWKVDKFYVKIWHVIFCIYTACKSIMFCTCVISYFVHCFSWKGIADSAAYCRIRHNFPGIWTKEFQFRKFAGEWQIRYLIFFLKFKTLNIFFLFLSLMTIC
jgi:hypothetical protein